MFFTGKPDDGAKLLVSVEDDKQTVYFEKVVHREGIRVKIDGMRLSADDALELSAFIASQFPTEVEKAAMH